MQLKRVSFLVLVLLLISAFLTLNSQAQDRSYAHKIKQEYQQLMQRTKDLEKEGYDISELKPAIKELREAKQKKDLPKIQELLKQAKEIIEKIEKSEERQVPKEEEKILEISDKIKEETKKNLYQIKVASHYRRITDGSSISRSLDGVIEILKETHTDFIFHGWIRQNPCPETCDELLPRDQRNCNLTGYSYEYLRNAVSEIKKEIPGVIFAGGVLAEFLNPECKNELTGETFVRDETWEMALDPSKWGIQKSKEQFQTEWAISRKWVKEGQPYNPKEKMHFYFPDLTNLRFKELFLSWIKKQIDYGVDAIWIDMLHMQPELLKRITGDINHKAVKDSYEAVSKIIDEIHKYGISKGRYIYVISWAQPLLFEAPYPRPDLDALMTTVFVKELRAMKMDEKKWDAGIKKIREKFGDIPIFARIDYGNVGSPLSVFSQELTKDEANQFLRIADEFFQQKGIIFIYPIHGGNMGGIGKSGKILSYGKYDWYDSLAPEFQTYETIKELAQKKAKSK